MALTLLSAFVIWFLNSQSQLNISALRQDNERLNDINRQTMQHLSGVMERLSDGYEASLEKQGEAQSLALKQVVAVVSESERRLMDLSSNAPVGGLSPQLWEQEHALKLMKHDLEQKKLEFQMSAQMPEIDRRRLIVEREQQKRAMKDRARVTQ